MSATNERMSVFGPTLRFKGELKAQEDIKIEGRIEGTIHHQQRIVVGAKGEVVATVNAAQIDVDGKVVGDMSAKKSIKVNQSAIVRGNLRAPSVLLGFQLGGIVGHKFLSNYRVSMDLEQSELRLETN